MNRPTLLQPAMSFNDITKVLGISPQMCRSYYCSGMKKLCEGWRLRRMKRIQAWLSR